MLYFRSLCKRLLLITIAIGKLQLNLREELDMHIYEISTKFAYIAYTLVCYCTVRLKYVFMKF